MRILPSLLASLACFPLLALAEETTTVRPADSGAALVNPAMGWTMHFYSNILDNYGSRLAPADALDDFPGLSTVYLRVPWAFLEPAEGQFDWSLLDTPAQRWISKGKQIGLRVTCAESWMRYATPEWVAKCGAQGDDFTPGQGAIRGGEYWEPHYDDPVFLEKLDRFLATLARRYDGNPNVAFVDIGSYGVWGEWHTLASSGKEYPDAVKRKHIELYRRHFSKTLLVLGDDVIGHDRRVDRTPLTDEALAQGIALRDDSILVQPSPRSWYHDGLAQAFWPRLPVILEHEHFGPSQEKQAWSGELLRKAVEDYHAAYLSIHWWPREFLAANRATIDQINRRLGYRLQLREATWPKQSHLGEPFTVRTSWANAGVCPCYPGGFVALTLKDAQGGIVSVHVDESFDLRDLPVARPDAAEVRPQEATFRVAQRYHDGPRTFSRSASPGRCELFLSVGQRDGTPRIALPLEGDDGQRRYRLGTIDVLPE